MFDESAFVSGFAARLPKPIFQRRQRTLPYKKLDQDAPQKRGQMREQNAAPTQYEQAAEDDKNHKGEMKNQHGIGKNTVNHFSSKMSDNTFRLFPNKIAILINNQKQFSSKTLQRRLRQPVGLARPNRR
jgi:hypothetical protein